jgi:hypothetical protein
MFDFHQLWQIMLSIGIIVVIATLARPIRGLDYVVIVLQTMNIVLELLMPGGPTPATARAIALQLEQLGPSLLVSVVIWIALVGLGLYTLVRVIGLLYQRIRLGW